MFFRNKSRDKNFKRLEDRLQALAESSALERRQLDSMNQVLERLEDRLAVQPEHLNQTDVRLEEHFAAQLKVLNQTAGRLEEHFAAQLKVLNQTAGRLDTLLQTVLGLQPEQPPSAPSESLSLAVSDLKTCLDRNIRQLQSDIRKHDMAVEDLLDEWEDQKTGRDSLQKHIQESSRTELLLLQLFESYQTQFWNLKHFASEKDSSWSEQIAFMEETLGQYRSSCQISMIQDCGVAVDYELHDVIDAVRTSDPALDKTVAGIYQCGYFYKGTVKKKARVSAYRLVK